MLAQASHAAWTWWLRSPDDVARRASCWCIRPDPVRLRKPTIQVYSRLVAGSGGSMVRLYNSDRVVVACFRTSWRRCPGCRRAALGCTPSGRPCRCRGHRPARPGPPPRRSPRCRSPPPRVLAGWELPGEPAGRNARRTRVLEATMQGPLQRLPPSDCYPGSAGTSIDDVDGQPARFSPRHGASRRDTDDCYVLSSLGRVTLDWPATSAVAGESSGHGGQARAG